MHRCRAASPGGAGPWSLRRHAGHLIQEDFYVPMQEHWEIRIVGLFSCTRR